MSNRPSFLSWCIAGAAILLVALLFARGLFYPFVLDDFRNIVKNPNVNPPSWEGLARDWKVSVDGLYVPLTFSFWSGLAEVSALVSRFTESQNLLSPSVFRIANFLLHAVNGWLVYSLFVDFSFGTMAAALGALLFLLHPIQTETVIWIICLRDLLSTMFCLMALRAYVFFLRDYRFRWGLAATLCFIGAIAAKPSSVMLPAIVALILIWKKRAAKDFYLLVGWAPLVALGIYWTYDAQPIYDPMRLIDLVPSFSERFLIAGDALRFYFGKLVLPSAFAIDYNRSPTFVLSHPSACWMALVPFALLLALGLFRKWRLGLISLGLSCIALLPTLGFFPFRFQNISTVADRYAYFAMLGPALAVALWVERSKESARQARVVVLLLVFSGLAVMTNLQVRVWKSASTLYEHALSVTPQGWFAGTALGMELMKQGRNREAIVQFHRVLKAQPNRWQLMGYLAGALRSLGREAEAEVFSQREGEISGQLLRGYAEKKLAAGDFLQAEELFSQAASRAPVDPMIRYEWGEAWLRLGNLDEARLRFQDAVNLNPDFFLAFRRLEQLDR